MESHEGLAWGVPKRDEDRGFFGCFRLGRDKTAATLGTASQRFPIKRPRSDLDRPPCAATQSITETCDNPEGEERGDVWWAGLFCWGLRRIGGRDRLAAQLRQDFEDAGANGRKQQDLSSVDQSTSACTLLDTLRPLSDCQKGSRFRSHQKRVSLTMTDIVVSVEEALKGSASVSGWRCRVSD